MPERKVYHYTSSHSYRGWAPTGKVAELETGKRDKPRKRGIAISGLIPYETPQAFKFHPVLQELNKPAVYCFHKPKPIEWTRHKKFPYAWNQVILRSIGWPYAIMTFEMCEDDTIELIEASVNPDSVFVFDYDPIFRLMQEKEAPKSDKRLAAQKYLRSRIPLSDYRGGYSLPEVLSFEPIPRSRVSLVKMESAFDLLVPDGVLVPRIGISSFL